MTDDEKKALIAKMPMRELRFRRKLINSAIRVCILAGDPLGGAKKYCVQLARIDGEIYKRVRKNGKKPTKIRAKVARMGARANIR